MANRRTVREPACGTRGVFGNHEQFPALSDQSHWGSANDNSDLGAAIITNWTAVFFIRVAKVTRGFQLNNSSAIYDTLPVP